MANWAEAQYVIDELSEKFDNRGGGYFLGLLKKTVLP